MFWKDGEFKFKIPELKVKIPAFKIKIPETQVKIPARDVKVKFSKKDAGGAVVGGAVGAILGSGIGLATFDEAISGAFVFGIAGAAIGTWWARKKAAKDADKGAATEVEED